MNEDIQTADPRLRRITLVALALAGVAALAVVVAFHHWMTRQAAVLPAEQLVARLRLWIGIAMTASGLCLLLLAGCAGGPAPRTAAPPAAAAAPAATPPDDNLDAVAWTQTAIELDLIYLQTYRAAQSQLPAALHDPHWDALPKDDRMAPLRGLKPAVVGVRPQPLETNVTYRLFVEAGKIKGEHDFKLK